MALNTEDQQVSDLIMYEADQRYTRQAVTLSAPATFGDQVFIVGQPLEPDGSNFKTCTVEANANAICLENVTILEGATKVDQMILTRGPAIVNEDQIDIATETLTLATIVTALAGESPPILTAVEPDQ